jgi:hypothetical protein
MALGGATALASGRMSKPQTLSAVNFGALLVHQYEEYQDPGWFPADRPLTKAEWAAGIAYTVIIAAGLAGPNLLMRDKNSPHAFTAAQMGRHDTEDTGQNAEEASSLHSR